MSAVVCYGFFAYLLIPKMPSLFWKWVVAIVAILTMAYIGFSRISEGGHYLTDVLAGYAIGIAWAGLVFTVIESLFLRRRTNSVQNEINIGCFQMTTSSNIRPYDKIKSSAEVHFVIFARLALFAKWPLIGVLMFLLGGLMFGALAYEVQTSPALRQWDLSAAQAWHVAAQNIPSSLVEYVIFGFFLGREIIILLGLILALYFLHKHFWREFMMLAIGSGGGGLLWYFLSHYFGRPRPPTQIDIVLSDPSFPSGHTLSAIVFYGFLAYLLVPRMPSRFWKWFVFILLTFVIAFIGYGRLILGGHYVTDVVAGYSLGIAWAGLVYTVVEKFFPRDKSISTNISESSPGQSTLPGLRSPGLFKRRPIIGVILILLGSLSFAALGYDVLIHGPLIPLDQSIYKQLIVASKTAPPRINELMIFGFFVGKQVILVIVTLLSFYFFYKRYWRELAMILISSAGGSVVWNFVVNYFARPRPQEQTGLAVTNIPSFPSGHTMSAIICYGFLAYLLVPKMPSRGWKWAVAIAAVLIMLFSGFSRIFEGSHYLTDVLGGYALGLAWAGLVYTLIEGIFIKKEELKNVEKS